MKPAPDHEELYREVLYREELAGQERAGQRSSEPQAATTAGPEESGTRLAASGPPADLGVVPGNLSSLPLHNEQDLREILEIRREQGDLFHGTLFEDLATPAAEGEFLEALRSAATSQAPAVTPASLTTSACEATYTQQLRQEQLAPVSNDLELVQTLRLASRQLDNKAADLDDVQQYPEADRLRGLARRLRKQARGLEGSSLPPLQQANGPATNR